MTPNTSAAVASTVTAAALSAVLPQYVLIIGGGLSGALYALWGTETMTRAQALRFVGRALLPAVVFASLVAEWVSRKTGLELREAFAPVSFLVAVFHRQGGSALLTLLKAALRAKP